ncbi:IclR family transcriptional regulator [Wohlfahrtiimonas larvae]|uniref:HTH-type transcriptional repressor AllR n=1 Tax=Wohlfahrtiimonas larvae TaxID=1157986 RepID=A0ABP9MMY7_9GAMM|nr:IclR family transcriptional regulator [Wohlfahrtiimonas larvae]
MKSTDRLLNILSYIASCGRPAFPKNISYELNIPLSTVYRILNILISWEFVTPSKLYGAYTLGAQSLKGQQLHQDYSIFGSECDDVLRELAENTGESAAIIAADYTETICIKMVESTQALRCSFLTGRSNDLISGASGKTLLAYKSLEVRNGIVERAYPNNLGKQKALHQELNQILEQGYGITVGEIDDGVLGISAPIFRHQSAIAVVTLMAPYSRGKNHQQVLTAMTLKASKALTTLINQD